MKSFDQYLCLDLSCTLLHQHAQGTSYTSKSTHKYMQHAPATNFVSNHRKINIESDATIHQNQTKLWRSLEDERDFDTFGDLDAARSVRLAAFPRDSREDLTSLDADRGNDAAELRFEEEDRRRDVSASPTSIASISSEGSPASTSLSV